MAESVKVIPVAEVIKTLDDAHKKMDTVDGWLLVAGFVREWQDCNPCSIFPQSLIPIVTKYWKGYDAKSEMIPLTPSLSHFKYRMPSLQVSLEGKGSGTHTVLNNLHEIAKSLRVFRGLMILKYIEMEIGELSVYSELSRIGYIHGIHRQERLQSILYEFVNEFVLCPKERCRAPETQYKVDSNLRLWQKCKSCGWKGHCHSEHPLKDWVLQTVKDTRDKEEKRKERKAKEKKEKRRKEKRDNKRRKHTKRRSSKRNGHRSSHSASDTLFTARHIAVLGVVAMAAFLLGRQMNSRESKK